LRELSSSYRQAGTDSGARDDDNTNVNQEQSDEWEGFLIGLIAEDLPFWVLAGSRACNRKFPEMLVVRKIVTKLVTKPAVAVPKADNHASLQTDSRDLRDPCAMLRSNRTSYSA